MGDLSRNPLNLIALFHTRFSNQPVQFAMQREEEEQRKGKAAIFWPTVKLDSLWRLSGRFSMILD